MDPAIIELLEEILHEFGHELKREAITVIVKEAFKYLSNAKGKKKEVEKNE